MSVCTGACDAQRPWTTRLWCSNDCLIGRPRVASITVDTGSSKLGSERPQDQVENVSSVAMGGGNRHPSAGKLISSRTLRDFVKLELQAVCGPCRRHQKWVKICMIPMVVLEATVGLQRSVNISFFSNIRCKPGPRSTIANTANLVTLPWHMK